MPKMSLLHTETLKGWGGQQNRVLSEALGLKERGHDICLACNTGSVISQRAKAAGIKVYELDINKATYHIVIPRLMSIIRKERVDIVCTHGSTDSWAGAMAARLTGRKLVRFRHSLYKIGKGPLTRLIYKMPDRIVAISESIRDMLVEGGVNIDRIKVIHSSVDAAVFCPGVSELRKSLNIPAEAVLIGNTSTFTEVKGQEYLFKAFNTIHRRAPSYLLLAGKIDEQSKRRFLSFVDREIRSKVIFLGHRDDIPDVLRAIDIFVFPSFLEGLGTALLEAMAVERPVAVSDIPTFKAFIRDGHNGIFFRPESPDDMAEKVVKLALDQPLRRRIGHEARNTILQRFTLSQMIDNSETAYCEVMSV